ncbi:hypothetical protein WR25_18990 [Diploscapter pachys]|uniref:G-protein coupled receptors family 1 profile domain-containing protein n=1 Tax=Diploscapter pachys TaxID=2018661 RepID=A0A2A2M074_9BILA|nr:hypothetical protein WR25_18990 [Diploscapter pachys]
MSNNSSSLCLTDRQMMLAINDVERLLIGKIVPFLLLFGVSGNILNLTVLLAPKVRTRSNKLLAALALADIVFLIFMLPHSLAHYHVFAFSHWFRYLYLTNKVHLTAIVNWASAAAIWFVLVICVERLIGIKYPLSSRKNKTFLSARFLIPFVVIVTGILTSFHHFSYFCATKYFCDGTQLHAMCIRTDSPRWFRNQTNPNSELVKAIARWGPHVNAILVVLLPVLLVILSNIMLICTLRNRQQFLIPTQSSVKWENGMSGTQMRTEHKVTMTVTAIVTCFTLTQAPSAFVAIIAAYYQFEDEVLVVVSSVFTTMVVLGKTLNFVLFCLSSTTFRQRLLRRGKGRLSTRSQSQLTASSGLMDYSSSEHRKWSRLTSGSSTAPSETLPLRRLARGATVI